jgi:hypothetical protein
MASKQVATESEKSNTKDIANKDGEITQLIEWATDGANSVEDLRNMFNAQGVSYSSGEEVTGDFRVITGDEKQLFLNKIAGNGLFVISWFFHVAENGTEFATIRMMVDGHGKFLINDGAKSGMYQQLRTVTERRRELKQTPTNGGIDVPGGVIKNRPFKIDKRTGKSIARMSLSTVPPEFQEEAHPSWKFDIK